MNIDILTTDTFDRDFRRLAKRHHSLPDDLRGFVADLRAQKIVGTELSPSVYKYRMAIKSKGRGKSGGARVITYEVLLEKTDRVIYLLTLYDKTDRSTITPGEIATLRQRARL